MNELMQLLWPGGVAVQAIHVAAKLGIADLVAAAGPKTAVELSEATRTNATSLARFLRALTSLGIFAEDTAGRYCQTALSDTLRADHPESIRPFAMMMGAHNSGESSTWAEAMARFSQPFSRRTRKHAACSWIFRRWSPVRPHCGAKASRIGARSSVETSSMRFRTLETAIY